MLFNTFHFFIFFILVTTTYFSVPHKYRWMLLLLSSCYFYMVFVPIYILILGFTIVIDYFVGILLEKTHGKRKKFYLIASLIANIGVLAVFKYFNFFNENLSALLNWLDVQNPVPFLSIILPIGLSFHTFQAMSYTIEVYRGKQKAEKNFGIYALYVMFYPQLVAGPIERPQNLILQFYQEHHFDYQRVTEGLKLIAWGLFKKMVIADRLAILVNHVYANAYTSDGSVLLLATIFFSFQIYCDFSGYSDIAIGAARVMGINLMKNFDRPYFSKSIHEFWKRWHISLSTWFRDYLYYSLGGNRVSNFRIYFNLFFVFLVSGFWHGANWTFIIWGALHGFYLIAARMFNPFTKKLNFQKFPNLNKFINVAITFVLVTFAWIFFRAESVSKAIYIITHLFNIDFQAVMFNLSYHATTLSMFGITKTEIIFAIFFLILMEIVHFQQRNKSMQKWVSHQHPILRWSLYLGIVLTIILFGKFGSQSFIYFQF